MNDAYAPYVVVRSILPTVSHRHGLGYATSMDRLTVPAAAERLGISENALRQRIQRDTIQQEHGDDECVYLYLLPDEPPTMTDHAGDQSLLITRLEDEVEYLRREVEDCKEEAHRKDAIIMTTAQHIPELEPARESPDARQTPGEGPDRVRGAAPNAEDHQEKEQRSWESRFFGR